MSLLIVTVLDDDGHVPFEIVQTKLFVPLLKPVTLVELELGATTEPVPLATDQRPVPVAGVFAESVDDEAQIVCDIPAFEIVGGISRVIVTVLDDEGQVPFEIVHTKRLIPLLKPVTDEEAVFILVTEPVPVPTDQTPVPVVGVFADSIAEEAHKVCEVPAFEMVGGISRVIVTVLVDEGHVPFEIVHTKLFAPSLKPVTLVELELGLVTEPVPVTTDQIPVPVVGELANNVVVDAHNV
jgi:hypothetical protein